MRTEYQRSGDKGNIILFTGAPSSQDLDWSKDKLLNHIIPSLEKYIGSKENELLQTVSSSNGQANSSLTSSFERSPKWRSMYIHPKRLLTELSQFSSTTSTKPSIPSSNTSFQNLAKRLKHYDNGSYPSDTDTSSPPLSSPDSPEPDSTYLEASFLLHESSVSPTALEEPEHSLLDDTTFLSTHPPSPSQPLPLPQITDLAHLPSPQTLKPNSHPLYRRPYNLLTAVLSISPIRGITLRNGRTMDLQTLLVMDDTKAPFNVAFWLLPPSLPGPAHHVPRSVIGFKEQQLRDALEEVRRGDVLLLTNVVLTVWEGRVEGQSWRGRTGIRILEGRGRVGVGGKGKLERVREAVRRYLPFDGGYGGRRGKKGRGLLEDDLPMDTQ
ncbi:hypothetical protein M501DRAFT_1013325 [Patellaria atrata CBS 101060]|uniref:Uncharacterized protein n=1 Tax=Patellaria atrata CBS 101060 TaxID=1346257 RepID=A0A9P4VQI1_9PEZI|nr:hypothetical protein M501DRAFT_1013325 [Patellaria atrata CBS 101060]